VHAAVAGTEGCPSPGLGEEISRKEEKPTMKEPVIEKVMKLIEQGKLVKTKKGWAIFQNGQRPTRLAEIA
jgi:hypothetical protein